MVLIYKPFIIKNAQYKFTKINKSMEIFASKIVMNYIKVEHCLIWNFEYWFLPEKWTYNVIIRYVYSLLFLTMFTFKIY